MVRGKAETTSLGIVEQKSTVAVAVEANALATQSTRRLLLKALHREQWEMLYLC